MKSPVTRLRTSAWPIVSWRRLAPITATLFGLRNRLIEADSATCSRLCMMPMAVSTRAADPVSLRSLVRNLVLLALASFVVAAAPPPLWG